MTRTTLLVFLRSGDNTGISLPNSSLASSAGILQAHYLDSRLGRGIDFSNVLNWSEHMDYTNSSIFSQKLKEFYWAVTRAVGLGILHDGSVYKHRKRL